MGQVRAVGAARESGILAVRGAEDVGLEYPLRESLTRIDAADAPEALRKPRSTFYKFFTPDHKLLVAASPLEPRIAADSRVSILVDKTRLTARGEFRRAGQASSRWHFVCPPISSRRRVTESMERFRLQPPRAPDADGLSRQAAARDLAATVTISQRVTVCRRVEPGIEPPMQPRTRAGGCDCTGIAGGEDSPARCAARRHARRIGGQGIPAEIPQGWCCRGVRSSPGGQHCADNRRVAAADPGRRRTAPVSRKTCRR